MFIIESYKSNIYQLVKKVTLCFLSYLFALSISISFASQEHSLHKVQQLFPDKAYGVDVSKYQGKVHWPQLREQIDFVFIKATEGVNTVDTYFLYNWQQAERHGIIRGAYHFFHGHINGRAQAEHLLQVIGKYYKKDLPLVVDVERARSTRFTSPKKYIQQLQLFISHIKNKTGDEPIIYTNYSFWKTFLRNTHEFSTYDLWVASYTKQPAPTLPKPWTSWSFWQISSQAQISGISSPADLNLFNGDSDKLYHYSQQ